MPFWLSWKKTQHETLQNLWVVSHQRGTDTSAHRPGIAALLQEWWGLFFQPQPLGLRVTEDFPSPLLIQIKSRWYHSESALSGDFAVAGRAKKVLRLGGVNLIPWREELTPPFLHQSHARQPSHRRALENTSNLVWKTIRAAGLDRCTLPDPVNYTGTVWYQNYRTALLCRPGSVPSFLTS